MQRTLTTTTLFTVIVLTMACGGGVNSGNNAGGSSSGIFVTGEDAPLPSVVSFFITLNTIKLNNSSGSVTVLSTATTVDFGRLIGLRSLLGFNTVQPGTYTSATFTMSSPVINYVNLTTNPPSLGSITGTLTNSTVTVSFPQPITVTSSGLAGRHVDFDLRDSLQVDQNGQITSVVNPVILVQAVKASDPEGQVTDFAGSVISVNTASNSFLIQGPWGLSGKYSSQLADVV